MEKFKLITIRKKEELKLLSKYIQAIKSGDDFYRPQELQITEMTLADIRSKYKQAYAQMERGLK